MMHRPSHATLLALFSLFLLLGMASAQHPWEARTLHVPSPLTGAAPVAGNMFDIHGPGAPPCGGGPQPLGSILIEGISVHVAGPVSNVQVWVLTQGGSHVGHEQDPGAWTLLYQLAVPYPPPPEQLLELPFLFGIRIPEGAVQGVYIATQGGSLWSHPGMGPVGSYLDGELCSIRVDVGSAVDGFANPVPGHAWHGALRYRQGVVVPDEYPTIGAAIQATMDLPILVHPGTYRERIDLGGRATVIVGLQGPRFTILDGGGAGTVVTARQGEPDAWIVGLSLRGGVGAPGEGGGVHVENDSTLTIRECVIENNRGGSGVGLDGGAGGIQVRNSTTASAGVLTLEYTALLNNRGGDGGVGRRGGAGGLDLQGRVDLRGASFSRNHGGQGTADASGVGRGGCGGLDIESPPGPVPGSGVIALESTFLGNFGGRTIGGNRGAAGAVEIGPGLSGGAFTRTWFELNVGGAGALGGAGAIECQHLPELLDCAFIDNAGGTPGALGGGPGVLRAVRPGTTGNEIVHSVFRGNQGSGSAPGAIDLVDLAQAGGMRMYDSILWGNSLPTLRVTGVASPTIEHCDVEGGHPGPGNIDEDPMFEGRSVFLSLCSPCIDRGGNGRTSQGYVYNELPEDPTGMPRPQGAGSDIGLYEQRFVYSGTQEDFEIEVLVDQQVSTSIEANDLMTVRLFSPQGTRSWQPVFLLGQVWPCGQFPNAPIPGILIDPTQAILLFGLGDPVLGPPLLPPQGFTLGYRIPFSIPGSMLTLQGLLLDTNTYFGYATTSSVMFAFR